MLGQTTKVIHSKQFIHTYIHTYLCPEMRDVFVVIERLHTTTNTLNK